MISNDNFADRTMGDRWAAYNKSVNHPQDAHNRHKEI